MDAAKLKNHRDNGNRKNNGVKLNGNGNHKVQTLDFDYVSCSEEELFKKLKTSRNGLSKQESRRRLTIYGFNEPVKKKKRTALVQFFSKFSNPLVIVLLIIAAFSLFFGQSISAVLVLLMAIMSVFLTFFQEYKAGKELEKLSEMVHTKVTICKGGSTKEIDIKKIVPGDIVYLSAGRMVPADLRIISCKDLFINQASLTGESFPVEKFSQIPDKKDGSISELKNIAFMGSSVVSGTGTGVVLKTGSATQFGAIAKKIANAAVETSFDKGIKNFTLLMIRAMLVMIFVIFLINALRHQNFIDSILFSLGVAVGLTPEMLPMIVSLNMAKGAIAISKKEVIVKRLSSIQNFGAMDILCTDKTGTLSMDRIVLERHCDLLNREDEDVLRHAYINSFYQTGLRDILDRTILQHEKFAVKQFVKVDEIPFDFQRRLMSVVVKMNGGHKIISKGAPEEIFRRCSHYELDGKIIKISNKMGDQFKKEYYKLSSEGFRILAVAYKNVEGNGAEKVYSTADEKDMFLKGYLAFLDPAKPTAKEAIIALKNLNIDIKVLTGDNGLVTKKICSDVGIEVKNVITGAEIDGVGQEELRRLVEINNVFVRLSPLQKESMVRALRENGHTVGFLGDGINDAPAMKAADVGISVNNAVDIAKESASIILMKKSLMSLEEGVVEGRKIFGNIIKYIKMGSSSNFGNMLSMTGATLFLPFLPMLPVQILINNFLYDLSQIATPTDEVDKEYMTRARPWNVSYIKKFMIIIGPVSSIFDFLTFAVMFFIFNASTLGTAPLFRTGWFIESLITQTIVIHIIRTSKIPFIESKPSGFLIFTSIFIMATGILIPLSSLGKHLGFVTPPLSYFVILFFMVCAYLLLVQFVKSWFIKKYGYE